MGEDDNDPYVTRSTACGPGLANEPNPDADALGGFLPLAEGESWSLLDKDAGDDGVANDVVFGGFVNQAKSGTWWIDFDALIKSGPSAGEKVSSEYGRFVVVLKNGKTTGLAPAETAEEKDKTKGAAASGAKVKADSEQDGYFYFWFEIDTAQECLPGVVDNSSADLCGTWRMYDKHGISHMELWAAPSDGVVPPEEIPEPAPIALMGLAFAGIALARRRGRANEAA